MDTGRSHHLSYLLRLWQAGDAEDVTWRASLESAHTAERTAFGSLAALFVYLEECTSRLSGREEPPRADRVFGKEDPAAEENEGGSR